MKLLNKRSRFGFKLQLLDCKQEMRILIILACFALLASGQRGKKKGCDDGNKPTCADGTEKPPCDDGNKPVCADGTELGPKCDDGNKPACADGTEKPPCVDGNRPVCADGTIEC